MYFVLFQLLVSVWSQQCTSTGCKQCIANETCSSCSELYDQKDNSCSTCVSLNPLKPIDANNTLVVFENGICVDKTNSIRKDYSDMITYSLSSGYIDLSFTTNSKYSIGPCSFPIRKQVQYRPSFWIKVDLAGVVNTQSHYKIILKTPENAPRIYVDVTNTDPTTSDVFNCYARQEIVMNGGSLTLPLSQETYFFFISIDDLTSFSFSFKIDFVDDFRESVLDLSQAQTDALYTTKKTLSHTFKFSSEGIYIYPVCAPTKLMKGLYFTIETNSEYSVLLDTSEQNRYAYLMEYTLNETNILQCIDYYVGDWWGIWSSTRVQQGLRVRMKPSENKRLLFVGTTDHSTDLDVTFSTICPKHCYESNGNGMCSTRNGDCVCSDSFGAEDCRKLCYYNQKFYKNDGVVSGDAMCYFGTLHCDADCACESGKLESHYCVSQNCVNKNFGDANVQCSYNTSHCLPNCICADGYEVTEERLCRKLTCGDGIVDEGEQCDNTTNCDHYCQCLAGYEVDPNAPGNCRSKPIAWWVWLLVTLLVIIAFIILVGIVIGVVRLTRSIRLDQSIFKQQQPVYYYDITQSVPMSPSEEARYNIEPLDLDYGNENVPTNVFDTRYELVDVKNYSGNKYMMVIIHTPNNPKFVFYFDPQVIFLRPKQKTTLTSYMTLHCTTKIMGMKIHYTVYWSKHLRTLKEIAELLRNKTFEEWTTENKMQMETLMKDVSRKYRHQFEIKTVAASSTHIDMDELHLREQPIAQGASGTVYVGKYKSITVAVKMFRWEMLTEDESKELKKDVIRECDLMSKLRNPFIANYMGSVTYIPKISMVIQFFQLGSLGDYVRHEKPEDIVLPYKLKVKMMFDCARGMAFLHENRIMHLDLKPDNLLVNSLYADSSCVVKITDFGTSRITKKKTEQDRGLGTPIYLAPEAFTDVYTNAGDVFSFAVLSWELFYAKEPYKDCKSIFEIKEFVISGKRLVFDDTIPNCFKSLVEDCWRHKMEERPSFDDISKRIVTILEDVPNHPEFDSNVSMERIEEIINEKSARVNELLAEQETE
ncbi:serine-threonine protein kinase, putative [Entamoeba invadens IP1]|uniref:Serine-threonine protein kinase, putative n=1 Tax=Entamoeba invadens IP1 TaxID=370355 RepID=L7FKI1_ENTIV|nr:serine-threonine protein kinase, putative [Entamoeba invadens IP1]ELP84819.1 serine-threonine protein kinase, putative [Entamoeba invadens IP1]|eukprot:XP_004184165.1 serine-threonine protein kinase, putative [Entamoeba invadens IP1]